jgi:excisionase family DNA binding protein
MFGLPATLDIDRSRAPAGVVYLRFRLPFGHFQGAGTRSKLLPFSFRHPEKNRAHSQFGCGGFRRWTRRSDVLAPLAGPGPVEQDRDAAPRTGGAIDAEVTRMSIDHDRVPLPAMLTDADVARVLRVSMPTLRRIVQRAEIRFTFSGKRRRYLPEHVLKYLKNQ